MSIDFYGSGITYPMQLGTSGDIHVSRGVQKVEESIRIILGTGYGERSMRPTFEDGLSQWEPRIDVLDVLVKNDNQNGLLNIEIHYRLHATQEVRSTTVPFSLEAP